MAGLRVLITNNALAEHKGTELYVRDVAEALLRAGHNPVVYSTELGSVAGEIRSATVPVVNDLKQISSPPDIIHGQHHLETMTALLRFPGVPAICFCHGWIPWEERPPIFSRIIRYVAVDQTCRDRLIFEHAIPEKQVTTLLNFVDLDRFPNRAPLPALPARALVLSNNASPGNYLQAVLDACGRDGISVDCIGLGVNNVFDRIGEKIAGYDIVFAKARSALEAMAVGTAVVLCDEAGMGPMVNSENLDRLRAINFGIRALRNPVTADALLVEIRRYDAGDATRVSQRLRETANIDSAVRQLICIYTEAIHQFHNQPAPPETAEELRQAADYLRWITPHIKEVKRRAFDLNKTLVEQSLRYSTAPSAEQVADLTTRLEAAETEIRSIKSTLGWRLLSGYGIIKHRYVLPAYGRLRRPKP